MGKNQFNMTQSGRGKSIANSNNILKKSASLFKAQKHVQMLNDDGASSTQQKQEFDKKSYRLKKYSKKYKLDHWEKQRRQKLMRNYYKEINCDPLSGKIAMREFDSNNTNALESHNEDLSNRIPGQFVLLPEKLTERQSVTSEIKKIATPTKNKKHLKHDAYILAKEEYKRIQDENKSRREAKLKAQNEREVALEEYRKKKAEKFKKLSQKTKKGQPVMKGRLELLYEKIQKSL